MVLGADHVVGELGHVEGHDLIGDVLVADAVSDDFAGAVDAYSVTYGSPVTKAVSQPEVSRDPATGAVTNRPALEVS